MAIIKFIPLYQERVWGGRDLEKHLQRSLPKSGVFGESWEVVDRPEAQSVVANGEYSGNTLRTLIKEHAATIMGPSWNPERTFPILVKWLDCQERLSLQVHPPMRIAPELKGEPKTECWFIAECAEGAGLLAGLRKGVTQKTFEDALAKNELEPLCHRFPIHKGDHIFIPSGRIHAIDAGNLILEIQQNSDTTYRVYDWGRVGLDGKPRQLHINQSIQSIDFTDFEPQPTRSATGLQTVADCAEFRIQKMDIAEGEHIHLPKSTQPCLIGIISGLLEDIETGSTISRGDNVLIPWASGASLKAKKATTLLLTNRFST